MNPFATLSFWEQLFASTIRMTPPLLLAALGALFSERAGMSMLGLEGIMTMGALSGYLATYFTGSVFWGLVFGAVGGILLNLIFSFFTVTVKANHIINGMALNILAPALATFLFRATFGESTTVVVGNVMQDMPIPVLSKLPFVGTVLFSHKPLVYVAFLLVPLTAFFFNRFKPGLNFRAVGEYPQAAESLGINVIRVKYLAGVMCGLFAGLAGAYLTVCSLGTYVDGIVSGRGYVALSALIFGRWNPVSILWATLFFGMADAFQLRLQLALPGFPYQLLAMLPYVALVVALVAIRGKSVGPKAVGQPYFREHR